MLVGYQDLHRKHEMWHEGIIGTDGNHKSKLVPLIGKRMAQPDQVSYLDHAKTPPLMSATIQNRMM
jgi:hypothetical protein